MMKNNLTPKYRTTHQHHLFPEANPNPGPGLSVVAVQYLRVASEKSDLDLQLKEHILAKY